jgi:hypothetical protein
MFRSKQFQLSKDTVAVLTKSGKRELIHIPIHSTISVLSEKAEKDGTVAIVWDGHIARVFQVDVEDRGVCLEPGESEESATA